HPPRVRAPRPLPQEPARGLHPRALDARGLGHRFGIAPHRRQLRRPASRQARARPRRPAPPRHRARHRISLRSVVNVLSLRRVRTLPLLVGITLLAALVHAAPHKKRRAAAPAAAPVDPNAPAKPKTHRSWPLPALGGSASGNPEVLFTFDDGP